MALPPTPDCPPPEPPILTPPQLDNPIPKKKKWKKKKKSTTKPEINHTNPTQPQQQQKPRKRTKSPGLRVVHGRVYDSENGKTCHQCRQKTLDLVASCKSKRNDKTCTIMFCHKCLLNRYGENAEESNSSDDWKCPRCRGVCNCSFCMKKRGHQPTGILVHTAKATGFGSVLEMLTVKGPENIVKESKKKHLEKNNTDENGVEGGPPMKRSKKVHPCAEIDLNIALNEEGDVEGGEKMLVIGHNKMKKLVCAKKKNGAESKEKSRRAHLSSEIDLNVALSIEEVISELVDGNVRTSNIKEKLEKLVRDKLYMKIPKDGGNKEEKKYQIQKKPTVDPTIKTQEKLYDSKNSQINTYEGSFTELIKKQEEAGEIYKSLSASIKDRGNEHLGENQKQITNHDHKADPDAHLSMPLAISLTSMADIELPAEDVMQFLEFCNAFGEELLSKEIPDARVVEPPPCIPLENLASWCNFVHMIS